MNKQISNEKSDDINIFDNQEMKTGQIVFETEVCVVGAGSAGVVAALKAIESGASVIVLQNKKNVSTQGSGSSAYGSRKQVDSGFRQELSRIKTLQEAGETNGVLLRRWFEKSGEVIDWIDSHARIEGMELRFDAIEDWKDSDDWLRTYPISGKYSGKAGNGSAELARILAKQAQEAGAQFIFGVTAYKLGRDGDGRVDSVSGTNRKGEIITVRASRGVIICTGGYEGNMDLRKQWLPHAEKFSSICSNMGEGILMGMEIGAAVDAPPHSSNIHYNSGPLEPFGSGLPWLRVDRQGRRYCCEDAPYGNLPLQDALIEDARSFQIFDANMGEQYERMTEHANGLFRTYPSPRSQVERIEDSLSEKERLWHPVRILYEQSVKIGRAIKADSLDELAGSVGFNRSVFLDTIRRINELYELGCDEDFGKKPSRMHPIEQAPFYAVPRKAHVLATLNGLVINENMQVLDSNGDVIPGLYAAGNASGGKFFGGLVQSMAAPSMTISRAQVWGYLASQHITKRD